MFSNLRQVVSRIRSGAIELNLRHYFSTLKKINQLETEFKCRSDQQLKELAGELSRQLSDGASLDKCLPSVFAIVREVAVRTMSMRPYDEQILAGIVLHKAKVAQMQTGEGKTLAAVAPVVLNGLVGQGVHVLTFNDYLAQRDAEWMSPIYGFLGLRVGFIKQGMSLADRRAAYACDITYVTAKEAGFDFLRDQLAKDPNEVVHRGFPYAIVDEADSVLIDEARVPLVIAGDAPGQSIDRYELAKIIKTLKRNLHYEIGDRARNVNFTATGLNHLEQMFGKGDLHSEALLPLLTRLNQALHAEHLLHRDIDYLVRDGKVWLLDALTGRVAENRRWPYGLQAAVEAKEQQAIQPDGKILNSITLQHFAGMYRKLSGMTGTAEQAAEEFHEFYGLKVVVLDTHKPCIRTDEPDQIYPSRKTKADSLVDEVVRRHRQGQPILIGTADVAESDQIGDCLRAAHVPCRILNARNNHEEARIVADAGTYGAVTVATNMAGRGTDIRLGGHDEHDRERVKSLGGLFVIGTNRHESRRIDNQLRGRAGRQGDPGQTRFIISLEDHLIKRFGAAEVLNGISLDQHTKLPLESKQVTERVAHIQRIIEGECFEIRRTLRRYSEILEKQRKAISEYRKSFLMNRSPEYILPELAIERYEKLAQQFGHDVLQKVEQQISLFQIDRCWADHLEHIAEVRDSIHLFSLGGLDPFHEFQRQASQAYRALRQRIVDEIVSKFNNVQITSNGIDIEAEEMLGPTSTWTYMINDHPAGDIFERFAKSVKRMLRRR